MMCGCPIGSGLAWIPDDFTVTAAVERIGPGPPDARRLHADPDAQQLPGVVRPQSPGVLSGRPHRGAEEHRQPRDRDGEVLCQAVRAGGPAPPSRVMWATGGWPGQLFACVARAAGQFVQQVQQPLLARQYGPLHRGRTQIREEALPMLDPAPTCGAAATAGMASGDPAATAATRRTFTSGRNLRMTCSFLVRFRSATVEGAHDAPYKSKCAPPRIPVQEGETGRRQNGRSRDRHQEATCPDSPSASGPLPPSARN
jgi:hypothetical protein